ncbi:unnamed protein product [Schistosoma rodhaini]|nr:unnamed protein product [Schistosoma rodhaini]
MLNVHNLDNVCTGQWLKNSTYGHEIMCQSFGVCVTGVFAANAQLLSTTIVYQNFLELSNFNEYTNTFNSGVDHHLSIDDSLSIISEMNTSEHDNDSIRQNNTIDHQMNDTFLAHLMNTNLQISSELVEKLDSSDIFQCQIRLFYFWYPQWSLEQRVQLVSNLKDIQLKSLNEIS